MNVEVVKEYSIEVVRNSPFNSYVFGDNLIGEGKGGQAIIRDETNAFGIPTKKLPSNSPSSYFTDEELEQNKKAIDEAINKIKGSKSIVFPKDGLGTGLARLKEKAPQTYSYLRERLINDFGFDNDTGEIIKTNELPEKLPTFESFVGESVICDKCNTGVDYCSIPESGMGYIKCPNCDSKIDQEGKVVEANPQKKYSADHLRENPPKYIEDAEVWKNAVDTATKNGKIETDYSAPAAIYKRVKEKGGSKDKVDYKSKGWVDVNQKLNHYEQVMNLAPAKYKYALQILGAVKDKQEGWASPRQKQVLDNAMKGYPDPKQYYSKN